MSVPIGQDLSFVGLLADRRVISKHSVWTLAFDLYHGEDPVDADGDVTVSVWSMPTREDEVSEEILSRVATRVDLGQYRTEMSSVETSRIGFYVVRWEYEVNSAAQVFEGYLEIGEPSPTYDGLSEGGKEIIGQVSNMLADLFDSPYGGPHLQVYFQSRFGRERMAQLFMLGLGRLNTVSQPLTTYTGDSFPYDSYGPLLVRATYVEVLKHLIRSYVEQPDTQGVVVARLDRRDYMSRWQAVLAMEERDLKAQMDTFKIAHMGLGRARVLVSGGVYGSYGPTRLPYSAAQARPWARSHWW